ncbi:MAG: GNAT family N-acetyltransferase [Candidatus Hermodarchaeia archaeon]|jgi:RimJ/RimL family protein N-acetyltransferase
MVLRSLTPTDPEIKEFKEKIQRFTNQFEPFGFTYQLYLKEDQPVGIAFIGQEPLQLFKPVGTPLIRFFVMDYDQPVEILNTFANEVLDLVKEKEVDFAYLSIPVDQESLAKHLEQIGFQELANRYEMSRALDDSIKVSDQLRYEQIKREEVDQFFIRMKEFMSGSPDVILEMVMKNFKDVPAVLLDEWYKMNQAYFVYHDKDLVGILDLAPSVGYIQNIGVAPAHRRNGYASEMLRFSMKLFKDLGREKAGLGLHVDNKRALRLYEKLGFTIDKQLQTLIWWK